MRDNDPPEGYGLVSIVLHWLSGVAVVALWLSGAQIHGSEDGGVPQTGIHTSLAIWAFPLLVVRVGWRLKNGHPPRCSSTGRIDHAAGTALHMILIVAIAIMLASGPTTAAASGLNVYAAPIWIENPAPFTRSVFEAAHAVHATTATIIIVGIGIHLCAVIKHLAMDNAHAVKRIFVACPPTAELTELEENERS